MSCRPWILVSFVSTIGCAETNIQAIHRLQPAYDVYRHELANLIVNLSPPGSVKTWTVPNALFPAPVFFEDSMNDPRATAEMYYFGEREQDVTLSIRSPISACLAWTGPKNPLHPDVWNVRGGLGEECDAARKRPWLVLVRVAESRLPERLTMEAFLIYVPSWKVVGAFPFSVVGRSRKENLDQSPFTVSAKSAFHQAASCELSNRLNNMPGAKFIFSHRPCDGDFLSIAVPESQKPQIAADPNAPADL